MSRRRLILAVSSLVGVCAVVLGAGWLRMRARRSVKDVLPAFSEPGPGPRAPSTRALGFAVGRTTLDEARAALARAGLDCPDTSIRALMQQARDQTRREMQARKARGEDPDAVTGASRVNYRSPKEANPQVRLACNDVPSSKLGDDERPPSRGRLLLVFDSPRHPLRHVSFERTFPAAEVASALADLDGTRARLADTFGGPGAGAAVLAEPTRDLPWLSPRESAWPFADLLARVSAINYGPRGVVVSEVVEVPWPIRADAPARASTSLARTSTDRHP
jgi:hypothetical protein